MVMNIREDEKLALFIDGANLYAGRGRWALISIINGF